MQFFHYSSLDSTNNEAKRLFKTLDLAVLGQGVVVTADQQTDGRGQFSRRWYSESDEGLYYTFMIQPSLLFFERVSVDLWTKVISERVKAILVEFSGLDIYFEWPNDLLLSDKKVGGILLETVSKSSALFPDIFLVGIGINFNHECFPDDLSLIATSLRQISGKRYNKDQFIQILSKELKQCLLER